MTPLAARLLDRVRTDGPMPVSAYMAACLTDPDHGYYTTRNPLGADGDFTTAPEIGQVFGEVLGLWLAVAWQQAGSPDAFTLAELGPGHGTLMADALRAADRVPGFTAAADLVLVEASPALTARQAARLRDRRPRWVAAVDDLPGDRPLFLIANEFLDALPLDQAIRRDAGWHWRRVGEGEAGRLGFVDGPPVDWATVPPAARPPARVLDGAGPGTVVEVPEAAVETVTAVAARLARAGGAALFLDYGSLVSGSGDTLQAVAGHRSVDPLDRPGEVDLTVQVDFAAMARAAVAAGVPVWPGLGQGTLLRRLGVEARTASLAAANPARAADLRSAQDRLIGESAMGTLFKAMALTAGAPAPAGFDAPDPDLELDPAWPR